MLEVTFVRKRGQRDHVYVRRADGSMADWAFPSYGEGLPHDLCHLVVEDELDLHEGFWGLVDQGVEVGLVNNAATLMRGGSPLADEPGVDLSGLMQAEAAVALLGSPAALLVDERGALAVAKGGDRVSAVDGETAAKIIPLVGADLPPTATPEAVARIVGRLNDYATEWRHLDDAGSIRLAFPTPRT